MRVFLLLGKQLRPIEEKNWPIEEWNWLTKSIKRCNYIGFKGIKSPQYTEIHNCFLKGKSVVNLL